MNLPAFQPDWQSVAAAFWSWIGHGIAFGTLLAIATAILLRIGGRRIRPEWQAVLWLIVLVKFVVPTGPALPVSLATAGQRVVTWMHPAQPAAVSDEKAAIATTTLILPTNGAGAARDAAVPAGAAREGSSVPWMTMAYLAVVVLIGTVRLVAYVRFVRACRKLPEVDSAVRGVVSAVCEQVGVRRLPRVRLSDDAPAPYIVGFFRPTLVLSAQQLADGSELEAVVLHEVAHLRRGDLAVRWLQWVAGTLLFFWPVVAWVNRRIDLARECACDGWALRHGRLSAGAYARCLLRAVHRADAGWCAYRPAAMAANAETVERRIEMVFDYTGRGMNRGRLGPVAVAALAAWACFALAGAATASDDPPPAQSSEETHDLKIVINGDDDEGIECLPIGDEEGATWEESVPADPNGAAGEKRVRKMVLRRVGAGMGKGRMLQFAMPSEKRLAEFLQSHPTADANSDGKLSRSEYSAFHVARALANPAVVMQQFPQADLNKDGQLSVDEAVQLVSGGIFIRQVERNEALPDGSSKKVERRVEVLAMADSKDAANDVLKFHGSGAMKWISENVAGEPAASEVAKYVNAVEEAPFAAILKAHPEADTDKDGKLSQAERDAYFAKQHEQMQRELAKKFPKADANGDGILSEEEMKNVGGVIRMKRSAADGSEPKDFVIEMSNCEGDKDAKIVIEQRESNGQPPK